MFRVTVSGPREQEASFFTVVVGRLQQQSWTAEDGSARSTVEVMADELGPSLRWATATTTRTTRSQCQFDRCGGAGCEAWRSAPSCPCW
jgi:single-strand DNA-binding protein